MVFKVTTVSSSLTIFATFLLISTASTARKTAVSPFCTSASDGVQCSNMAGAAKNWPEAMTNVITAAIDKAKAQKTVVYDIGAKLPGNLRPQSKQSIDSTCKEALDTLISNMEECLGYVKDDPTSALKYYLPSLTFFDCQNALEEFGVSLPEVNQFNDELVGMNSNLVAVLDKKST